MAQTLSPGSVRSFFRELDATDPVLSRLGWALLLAIPVFAALAMFVPAGAAAVKARGGTVIIQDPRDAKIPEMPANVLRQVKTDYCVPVTEIPSLLTELIDKSRPMKTPRRSVKDCENANVDLGVGERDPSGLTCPDCGGVVAEIETGGNVQFRCHVGHNFSLQSFTDAQSDALERALWIALRRLNEQRAIHGSLAERRETDSSMKKRYLENAAAAENDMKLLHQIIARL